MFVLFRGGGGFALEDGEELGFALLEFPDAPLQGHLLPAAAALLLRLLLLLRVWGRGQGREAEGPGLRLGLGCGGGGSGAGGSGRGGGFGGLCRVGEAPAGGEVLLEVGGFEVEEVALGLRGGKGRFGGRSERSVDGVKRREKERSCGLLPSAGKRVTTA